LKIVEKIGTDISLLALPSEEIYVSDYISIEDEERKGQLIVQVYEEQYLDHLGTVEDMVRDEVLKATVEGVESDPLEISGISYILRDMRLLKCKIRGSVDNNQFTSNVVWLPSRVKARLRKLRISELMKLAEISHSRPIPLGEVREREILTISAESLDGKLNVITGRKESGKSHLAKLISAELVRFGAYVFIFDLNNEYGGLAWNRDGSPSRNAEKTIVLSPGSSMLFTLPYLGLSAVLGILTHVLDIPGASLREFIRMWKLLESQMKLSMRRLGDTIQTARCNEFIRDALQSRFYTMVSSGLFSDEKSFMIEDIFSRMPTGGLVIISLGRVSPLVRRIIVEIFLGKLVELLEKKKIPPIFLFAEEAHLYLRETYWDDIVTRMRHFGIFTTFITNQPDAIGDGIFRQVDNIFLFNFTNDTDLEKIARISMVDTDTVKSIVRTLPQRSCLTLGRAVSNLPIVVEVTQTETRSLGETRLFFRPGQTMYQIQQQS
jgi:hypothetical protein